MAQVPFKTTVASELLWKALAILNQGKGWTKGSASVNAQGKEVPLNSSDAVCFCASGAIDRAASNLIFVSSETRQRAVEAVAREIPLKYVATNHDDMIFKIVNFNDHPDTTFEMVREVFLKARENLK